MDKPTLLKRMLTIAGLIAGGIFVYLYFSAFLPILLALFTAISVEPLVKWVKRKLKVENRLVPVVVVFSAFIVLSGYFLYLSMTKIAKMIYDWALNLPKYAAALQRIADELLIRVNEMIDEIPQGYLIAMELEKQSENLTTTAVKIASQLINVLGSWLQSIPNMLFVTLIYLIVFFLISLDFPKIITMFFRLFKEETSIKLQFVFQKMNKVFFGYWKAQFLLSIGVFIITYLSLLFIKPSAALFMATAIWFVDIIPLYVGPALVLVPWGIIEFIIGNSHTGIQLIVLATVLLVLRRAIEPKVLGDSIGLAVLPTVLTMYFGYVFFGMAGLIFGPFVYIAIRTAIEGGLFNMKLK